jgi:hypothetical protein
MHILDDILYWFFSETIWAVVLYLVPLAALGIGIWLLVEGELVWGAVWILGSISAGYLIYNPSHRRDEL